MDLCCLIDSERRLPASDLVTMVGDLLERGKFSFFLVFTFKKTITVGFRDEIPCEAPPSRANTHRQALARPVAGPPARDRVRHRVREPSGA